MQLYTLPSYHASYYADIFIHRVYLMQCSKSVDVIK